ncbi:ribosomal RNA large subunit 23S rRNA pseudouridine synthase D [Acetobacter estunensis NRIC 0472]|uniref:Pseudouridine synthase n=1 Tax=Acetobacter estunensis TaxID=104097 RepID=A0A967B7N5_9PROT|nr:RluA family pseudouridine synthase [Acetobacter estunensis]NHO53899.1 RluA family pseudouridine synthase [Acetobacter estunensis]GBQ24397.1 ribosomal RNA large subunit 23S rRNA pseudouridine synthase D [Acetobacter estunensis NRIC 0472]
MTDSTHGPRSLILTEDQAGQRLDRVLTLALPELSRSRIKSLIESGCLTCNGVVLHDVSHTTRTGMALALDIPPPAPATPQGEDIPFTILYEDEDLLVLDKPAGMVVHPAPGHETGTLVNALIAHCGESLKGIGGERRPGIVHRLDKDTSGIMVVAKTEATHLALSADFAARRIDRAYLALCWGVPSPTKGEYEGNIGRDPRDRKRMALLTRSGKTALTRYTVLRAFGSHMALVECRLATGRTHQIRVHFAANGHPLLGDPLYLRRIPAAAKGCPVEAKDAALDFPRQALHARKLGFVHPRTGEALLFETPAPADFIALETMLTNALIK